MQDVFQENVHFGRKSRLWQVQRAAVSPWGWTLYVNGQKAGDHLQYFKWIDPVDITPYLKKGKNVLALEIQAQRFHGLCDAFAGEEGLSGWSRGRCSR